MGSDMCVRDRENRWDSGSGGFFCQAEDGIRDLVRSRGLGDVYKRQSPIMSQTPDWDKAWQGLEPQQPKSRRGCFGLAIVCLLYTSDAAGERSSVDLGGRRILKKRTCETTAVPVLRLSTILRVSRPKIGWTT